MHSLKEILEKIGWKIPDIEKFINGRRKIVSNHISAFTHLLSRGIDNKDVLYFKEIDDLIKRSSIRKEFKKIIFDVISDKSLIDYDIPIPLQKNISLNLQTFFVMQVVQLLV